MDTLPGTLSIPWAARSHAPESVAPPPTVEARPWGGVGAAGEEEEGAKAEAEVEAGRKEEEVGANEEGEEDAAP